MDWNGLERWVATLNLLAFGLQRSFVGNFSSAGDGVPLQIRGKMFRAHQLVSLTASLVLLGCREQHKSAGLPSGLSGLPSCHQVSESKSCAVDLLGGLLVHERLTTG